MESMENETAKISNIRFDGAIDISVDNFHRIKLLLLLN